MINSITLSTGKTIKIPIFKAPPIDKNYSDVYTRSGGVLIDIENSSTGGRFIYDPYTDAELKELFSILYNIEFTTISNHTPSQSLYSGHKCCTLYWYYLASQDTYCLHANISRTNNILSINYAALAEVSGPYFYNNLNMHNADDPNLPITNFWDLVSSNQYHAQAINIRPGGVYSIDMNYAPFGVAPGSSVDEATILNNVTTYHENHNNFSYTEINEDFENPYGIVISTPGGGDGDEFLDPDNIDKAIIPELPTLSAVDAGLITMYYATNGQLNALAGYLWSNIYDLETNFVKLFSSPMDCIIGLGIVPVMPSLAGAANVKFGNINTNISMSKLSSQFVEKDMGSISIPKWIGSFLDFSPYVKLSLYLPYIGYRDLAADDVVGDTIHVVYHIDCLTGGCCAFVETGKKGLLYTFNGSCIANVPLTATNYSTAIQNAVSAVGAGLTTVAGIATGAAPIAVAGIASGLSSAANTALNSKPSIQRSGSMGGAAGIMSYQRPMLIIERPNMCVPKDLNHFKGNTLYITKDLSTVSGFTQIDMINLDNVPCTNTERKELETLLKEGVYF